MAVRREGVPAPMTYRNDPYDPKQVALLDPAALDDAVSAAEKAFAAAADPCGGFDCHGVAKIVS